MYKLNLKLCGYKLQLIFIQSVNWLLDWFRRFHNYLIYENKLYIGLNLIVLHKNVGFIVIVQWKGIISILWRRLFIFILLYINLLNSMDTHKHGIQEKLFIKKAFLWLSTSKIVIRQQLVNNQKYDTKNCFNRYCIAQEFWFHCHCIMQEYWFHCHCKAQEYWFHCHCIAQEYWFHCHCIAQD